ncbi:MAG TPA: non-canonical purine NTP pyrophosphatase [Verrucomicrobiae bacterium]|nr:non-canonical purine NTP pyrophosphatase [Verrucomicrobiae bacterium]
MSDIYVVTGNANKLAELQAIFPPELALKCAAIEIPEIQGEPHAIVEDKLAWAYETLGQPVIVEDVSVELDCLNGLPGPFIKHFEEKLGKTALWELARHYDNRAATVRCTMGYFDGADKEIVDGAVRGTIVSPRGTRGWGFDFVFMPDGHDKTNAQMDVSQKNQISHRASAARALAAKLSSRVV